MLQSLHPATHTTATMLTVAIVLMVAPTTHITTTMMPIPRTTHRTALIIHPAPQTATENG